MLRFVDMHGQKRTHTHIHTCGVHEGICGPLGFLSAALSMPVSSVSLGQAVCGFACLSSFIRRKLLSRNTAS